MHGTTTGASCMAFQRGEVVLVPFPFSDLTTAKVRPAVVVSGALYQSTEPDLILAAVTSRLAGATGPFDYVLEDWESAGLRYPSALKPVLFTLEPGRVIHQVGELTARDLVQVSRCLALALEL